MAREQLYRICDVLPEALGEIVLARPRAEPLLITGRWGDIVVGWRGQIALLRARLMSEVAATRLSSSGQALNELAASEFFAELPAEPRTAVGEVVLDRTVSNDTSAAGDNFTGGVVPTGKRFRREANESSQPPRADAVYTASEPVVAGVDDTDPAVFDPDAGKWVHTQRITVPIEAIRVGPQSNTPYVPEDPDSLSGKVVDSLFDKFSVVTLRAAGGTLGAVDEQLRALATVMYTGLDGPDKTAAIAGVLSNPNVRRVVYATNPSDVDALYIADESWASSDKYTAAVLQSLTDAPALGKPPWLGFGARVNVRGVQLRAVSVHAVAQLEAGADKTPVAEAVRSKVADYFDERPDWWTWRIETLGGVISVADPLRRIRCCTQATVHRASDNILLSPPSTAYLQTAPTELTHYFVASDGMQLTFETPS